MKATVIDGKAIAKGVREEVAAGVGAFEQHHGYVPGLTVILVGEDPASQVYVRNKERGCVEVGMKSDVIRLPEETAQGELLSLIERLNGDTSVHGILVQLPLPAHIDEMTVLRTISPKKDVDGFHVVNAGALFVGEKGIVPCTAEGVMMLIRSTGIGIKGKRAVVVGRSNIVGKPVSILLLNEHATVTMAHSRTENLAAVTREADILVVAVGRAGLVGGDMIKPGAVVIDVGTNRVEGKLKGDVRFDEAAEVAAYLTPVPGGVGPMTIAVLLKNTLEAAKNNA